MKTQGTHKSIQQKHTTNTMRFLFERNGAYSSRTPCILAALAIAGVLALYALIRPFFLYARVLASEWL